VPLDDNLPDIRIVTVSVPVEDDAVGEVDIDASGVGYYEALGMLLSALFRMAMVWDDGDPDD
jgi:hypothetical protein